MKIQDLVKRYAMSPQVGAVADTLRKKSVKTIFLEGLLYSSAPMLFASLSLSLSKKKGNGSGSESSLLGDSGSLFLFVLQDAEEAGYFYHDLVQLLGDKQVLFFPSSYRRAVKYGQRDAASEILRTEVLSKLSTQTPLPSGGVGGGFIVTYPDAIAELVTSQRIMNDNTLVLKVGDTIHVDDTAQRLRLRL